MPAAQEAQALPADRIAIDNALGGELEVGSRLRAYALAAGRAIRVLSVVDVYTRECLVL